MSARPWLVVVTLAVWVTVLMILVGARLSPAVPVQHVGPDGPAVTCLRGGQLVPCDP